MMRILLAALFTVGTMCSISVAQQLPASPFSLSKSELKNIQNLFNSPELKAISSNKQDIYGNIENLTPDQQEKISAQLAALSKELDKVIYGVIGQDDRYNFFDSKVTQEEKIAASASAALVWNYKLLPGDADGYYNLPSTRAGLCNSEQFSDEPAAAFCSGVRVGKDLIATAGHCVQSQANCADASVLFGYRKESVSDLPEKSIRKSDVYQCVDLVDRRLDNQTGADWSLIRVDREIDAAVPIATFRMTGSISTGDRITVIGYPMGLPLKVTKDAVVKNLHSAYFEANPDTYGGNSGSPVFNAERLEAGELFVEGLLVRGSRDFKETSPCMISNYCPVDEGCPGANGKPQFEEVTKATEFAPFVK